MWTAIDYEKEKSREEGINEGVKQERASGVRILVETLEETEMETNEIIKKVQEKYRIPVKEIRTYLKNSEYKAQ